MASERQQKIFKNQKIEALMGLISALDSGRIPYRPSRSLTSGQIIELLEDKYLRVPKKAMLTVLRDAGIYHDSNNRFTTENLHLYTPELRKQRLDYLGMDMKKVRESGQGNTNDSQE